MPTNELNLNYLIDKINSIEFNTSKEDFWAILSNISKEYEQNLDELFRRSNGIYYTDLYLAKYMIDELFSISLNKRLDEIDTLTFFEPCVGIGNFVFAYLKKIDEYNFNRDKIKKILENIYICDIDTNAINLFIKLMIKFCKIYFDIELDQSFFTNKIANGLLFNLEKENCSYINIKDIFPKIFNNGGFDIIVTNPPYKNLKAEKNKYTNIDDYEVDKQNYCRISEYVKKYFKYSNNGVLNIYKLFVEEIVCNYSKDNAIISLLIPSTILTDKSCEKLRTMILENHSLKSINTIPENSGYINTQQALCTILIEKGTQTDFFYINNDISKKDINSSVLVKFEDLKNLNMRNSIFTVNNSDYKTLFKLKSFPTVGELPFIINMRGELDLTTNKQYITEDITNFILLRGKNISYYKISLDEKMEYVKPEFVDKSPKALYIQQPRIVCQQIANIHKERRITFSYIPKNYVLGNSCNFMSVLPNDYNIDIFALLGIMNSTLINWLFKLTSSNNHINNYELDMLPIPIHSKYIPQISKLVQQYIHNNNDDLLKQIDSLVNMSYNLSENTNVEVSPIETIQNKLVSKFYNDLNLITSSSKFTYEDASSILDEKINIETIITNLGLALDKFTTEALFKLVEKYKKLNRGVILNHTTFKLSELDLEMVRSVPQGGNWKNIPEHIIAKSQRLTKISQTGGRTTLYGRIDYSKPSYTITTYFNRPGNGTYIHPIHDRVISVREAARFQSFKDSYYFTGNKSDLLKQVGNAVPPLLAFTIAKTIRSKLECNTSIDLFCGAGGMTVGFKDAGIKSIAGLDFDRSACLTLKINNPEINVICDDITKPEVKEKIISLARSNNIDMVCGGPPCQGFSHAGKRFVDDPRNQLFKDYIEIVSQVKPKLVVMENVEGMLTFLNGEIYSQIVELFSSLGYKTEGRLLLASEYGVPQKRKRLILICVRNDINVLPCDLFPNKLTPEPNQQVTALEAIGDLENIPCDENSVYDIPTTKLSKYIKIMREIIPIDFTESIYPEKYVTVTTSSIKTNLTKSTIIDSEKPVYHQITLFESLV